MSACETGGRDQALSEHPDLAILKIRFEVGLRQARAFEAALAGMLNAAARSNGCVGAEIVKPEPATAEVGEWQALLRFQSEADVSVWRGSPTAKTWRTRLEALAVSSPRIEQVHGLEIWFSDPCRGGARPAPKWKMAIVTSVVIYPFLLINPILLSPIIGQAPDWVGSLAAVAFTIPLMTWVVMPTATRLLRGWLYESRPPSGGPVSPEVPPGGPGSRKVCS